MNRQTMETDAVSTPAQPIWAAAIVLAGAGFVWRVNGMEASLPPVKDKPTVLPPEPKPREIGVAEDAEISLDGKPATIKDIPLDAELILLEVAPDKKTIVKVHFRTKK